MPHGESNQPSVRHRGPHAGILAIVYATLFTLGLSFVVKFSSPERLEASSTAIRPYFPGPWESAETIVQYFQTHAREVLLCAFFQFGAAIPLAILTATLVSQLRFLRVRAAGIYIALVGGMMTAINVALSSLILWVMAYPGIAQDAGGLRTLYYVVFAIGGVGFSVPMGLLLAGVSIPAAVMKLLPRWLTIPGIILAAFGELSFLSLVVPGALFLIPLTRFPSFLWLILAGFRLSRTREAARKVRAAAGGPLAHPS